MSPASIYKMFPADKKRVESALAAAHLPKGKVGESPSGPYLLNLTLCVSTPLPHFKRLIIQNSS